MDCRTPGFPVLHLEFARVHVHCISDAIQPPHSLTHSSPLPSIFTNIRDFSDELSVRIRWPKYWNISFDISPSGEHLGLISLKIDWFDHLMVQGTFRSLPHYSLKASIFWHSAFFTGGAFTALCGHWEDHSLHYADLCWQSNMSAFQTV